MLLDDVTLPDPIFLSEKQLCEMLLVLPPQTCSEGFAYDRRARQCVGECSYLRGRN